MKWLDALKQGFDGFLMNTFFSGIRKTETNIKRIDRFKKTIVFFMLQIVVISLFCVFGIAETKQLMYEDTIVITGKIYDYIHIEITGKTKLHYYNLWVDGEKYRIPVNDVTCKKMQGVIQNDHTVEFRVRKRIFRNDIVEFFLMTWNSEHLTTTIKVIRLLEQIRLCCSY